MKKTSSEADRRPTDPDSGAPIGPLPQPGYYPKFQTLSQQKFWDATTREVVLDRVENVPDIRFFDARQAKLLEAICNCILPQDDRDQAHRIAIVPQIDRRLYEDSHDGYRFEQMPPDREAYTLGLEAIEQISHALHERGFVEIGTVEQEAILRSLHQGKPSGAHEIWNRMPVHRFWMLLVQDCAEAYYAHPWAWDEIGFGGPAYPRAYIRLERGEPEPWETAEERYAWRSPASSISGEYEPVAGTWEHADSPGQGGTH
ncbi:MAG TPA: gluconate 2-dehydrogenase subunit 3 family protein [Candidatus Tumulicola sp.]